MFLDIDKKLSSKIAAIDDSGALITYGALKEFCEEFYDALPRRTLIFIMAENVIGSLGGYVAALSNRIVPLIINAHIDRQLYETLKDLYQPEFIWGRETLLEGMPIVFSKYGFGLARTGLLPDPLYDELSLLLPTSGSTGSPKLVRHSYRNVESNARNVASLFNLNDQERAMASLPMHYTMGLSVISSHLYAGATLLLSDKSLMDASFWRMMKEERATSFTGVPYSFEILNKMRFFRMDLPYLKLITQGGGKLPDELFKTCAEYVERTGKRFIATYGQTEGTARMAYLAPELAMTKVGSIGGAIPNGSLSIIDESGHETSEGEAVGEMIYRGPNVTLGYAVCGKDLDKGDENNGILHTGDVARRDKDGCYYIVGRMKRFLKIFGLRIGLDEVEHLVKSAFDTDCLCGGDDEKLIIKITNRMIPEQVLDFVVQKTKLFHKNVQVEVVDVIKRNAAGKVILN